jgi:predicted DNA-binding transcriptional regulator AlpA
VRLVTEDRQLRNGKAAEMIGVHPMTLWRWGNQGQGPKFTILVGERRYRVSDIIAWLESRETGGEEIAGSAQGGDGN